MKVKGKLQIPSTNSREIFESKLQTPTSKLQRNFKHQTIESTKFQAPNSRETSSSKLQIPVDAMFGV
jgi:hypothetical protein